MKQTIGSKWISRALLWIIPGSAVLGTSCAGDIRKNLVAAGLGFVKDGAGSVLDAAFPVADWLSPD